MKNKVNNPNDSKQGHLFINTSSPLLVTLTEGFSILHYVSAAEEYRNHCCATHNSVEHHKIKDFLLCLMFR